MADYLHGAYGRIQEAGNKIAAQSQKAIVYVGTAPVHNIAGGAANVNKPVLVQSIAEAQKYFGYSDDWANFTLCEAMQAHLVNKGVGPLVLINVLDPATHKATTGGTASLTPSNGRIVISAAQNIILDSVAVTGKTKGTHYTVAYDSVKKTITIAEMTSGGLGTSAIAVTYDNIDPSKVTDTAVIGASDGAGLNTGIFAVKNVYQVTGLIPSFLLCPGFSSIPAVHEAMYQNSLKVNGHWDMYMMADIPIVDSESEPVTFLTAGTWKNTNGYTKENETVYFPLAKGTDGMKYHISVLAAANFQEMLIANGDIPYMSASNSDCPVIQNLYLGAANENRVFDEELVNETLNKNGIASAAYVGGRWAIWGFHCADYNQTDADQVNVAETNRMMLYHVSNDFQHRRSRNSDKPMTPNDVKTIVAQEQTRLDALVKIGALTYGEIHMNSDAAAKSDIVNGDFLFTFNVTTTPLAKSLTAQVNWTDQGFVTYFAA